ncbi:MAG: twin-arginine translocase TatA/TatE family subunit [Chloroflexi bacterium]|nr:twin-arginine translocase TatA/TatE family subunit [Chloroflexota bacterium]
MGPLEVLLVIIIALIIWGPGKIPEVARTMGSITRTLRKTTSDLTTMVTKELSTAEKSLPDRLKEGVSAPPGGSATKEGTNADKPGEQ